MDLYNFTIKAAHEALKSKQISVAELVSASLDRIKKVDEKLHAFLLVADKEANKQAVAAQKRLDEGDRVNSLLGIPMAHKDVFCTRGIETTASSNILKGYIPPYSATVVESLDKAGAVSLGKLNCDAFAHGSSTENSDFGPTKNPYNTDYVPGGSSGGSAAAVASGEVLFATATDTGGSIRHPAGFCNVVGLKPTYGRVSRYGVIAMASSTDSPGPITRTVEDCAFVLSAMAGYDGKDSVTSKQAPVDYMEGLKKGVKGLRIGIPNEFFAEGLDPAVEKLVRAAVLEFERLGAKIEGVTMPTISYSLAAYYIIMPSEVSSNLARYDGIKYGYSVEREHPRSKFALTDVYMRSRGDGFGAEAKRRIMLGTYALSSGYYDAYYKKAQKVRQLIRQDFEKAFENFDLLLAPVSPTPPFRLGEKTDDPLSMYLSDIYTTSMSLAGNPAISVPCGFVSGLPVGLQLVAPHFKEDRLFTAAYAYEQATKFWEQAPKI